MIRARGVDNLIDLQVDRIGASGFTVSERKCDGLLTSNFAPVFPRRLDTYFSYAPFIFPVYIAAHAA